MKGIVFGLVAALSLMQSVCAQDLMKERIRKIGGKKRSVYFDEGVFHNGGPGAAGNLKGVRHSFSSASGFERIVFDFKEEQIPRVHGFLNKQKKKLYLDFYATELEKTIGSFGKSHFVERVDFFPITKEMLSLEIVFKENVLVDIFSLSKSGRLVIDVKK